LKAETEQRNGALKGRFPFRLGTTSYIIPDDLAPNVRYLADKVDDVELVLFESDEVSNLPDEGVIETLGALAESHDLTYTVHLPLDIDLGSRDALARQRSVEKCCKVVRLTEPLQPFAYLLHLPGRRDGRAPADDLASWTAALEGSIQRLLDDGPAAEVFCVETLAYPYEYVWGLVQRHGLAVCLDIGHILLGGYDLAAYLDSYLPRCRVVHLHGIREGKDHRDIGGLPRDSLVRILGDLDATAVQQARVLTLEVFNQRDFDRSLGVLWNWL
jgi:sugar phosphate isomerase/epimerase